MSSKNTQTHDGGGDTHAIAQMVKYALSQYKGNADRVYSTGDSSGAMMTELLMAVYPDIFKAGVAFAGVPAGCSNVFDGSGLCGLSAQTAQQWGQRVRDMYPGYSGHRPRVQLFHGDADGTITYKNVAEAIKEWTNVLSLSTDPTTKTDSGITLGSHQGKRQEWKNACGYVALDVFTSVGGDHGPSDCLFIGKYLLPFLGLDSQAAVNAADPEIAQCGGSGGDGGVTTPDAGKPDGAMGGTGGNAGGTSGTAAGGTGGKSSGTGGSGGTSSASGGSGGNNGSSGGSIGTGGAQGSGGQAAGGSSSSATGGSASTGGTSSSSSSSKGGSGGSSTSPGGSDSGGCGCSLGASQTSAPTVLLALALPLLALRRRRR